MADARKLHESAGHSSEVRESVPALEVPFSNTPYDEDEMLSWLQYPPEDSFDKNYCSEEPYPQSAKSHSDVVDNAFSNLTLREATHTWGVPGFADTKKAERILTADMAMAMGAQRAAGLLFQSGVDTFNKVRTNAQPHVVNSGHSHVTKGTSGSACGILKVERPDSPSPHVAPPNFLLFSCAAGVKGMGSEQAAYDNSKDVQRAKLGFIRHAGCLRGNQAARVATSTSQSQPSYWKNLEQSSTATDTPMIAKDSPSRATEGTCMGFSSLPLQQKMNPWTSNETMKETLIGESRTPAFVSSELEAQFIGFATHTAAISGALTSQHTGRGLLSQSAPAIPCVLSLGASAGSSGKRMRSEAFVNSQENPSVGSTSVVLTDMDPCRQFKLARHARETNLNFIKFQGFSSTKDLESEELCPLRMDSGITTSDSQLHQTAGVGDAPVVFSSRAWETSTSNSAKKVSAFSTKRKAENLDIECKVFKDEKLLHGHVLCAKGIQAADIQLSERESDVTGEELRW